MIDTRMALTLWVLAALMDPLGTGRTPAQSTSATTAPAATGPTTASATMPTTAPATTPSTLPMTARGRAGAAFAAPLEQAHGREAWLSHPAVQATMHVMWGDQTGIDGTLTYDHHGNRVRIEQRDGTLLIFDGEKAWVSPAGVEFPSARFQLLTWPYFLAAPFKLRDPGARLESLGELSTHGEPHPAARLTFDDEIGDAPDDWYVACREPDSNLLCTMGYIVTYFADVEEAEKEPHAVVYSDYIDVSGAQISTRWDFHHWSQAQGAHGESLGHATLSNVRFVTPAPDAFTAPADARIDPLPQR